MLFSNFWNKKEWASTKYFCLLQENKNTNHFYKALRLVEKIPARDVFHDSCPFFLSGLSQWNHWVINVFFSCCGCRWSKLLAHRGQQPRKIYAKHRKGQINFYYWDHLNSGCLKLASWITETKALEWQLRYWVKGYEE